MSPRPGQRDLERVHRYAHSNQDAFPSRRSARGPADVLEEVSHPLVRTHPVARTRSLFLDLDRAKHVEGMPVAEGRSLLQDQQDHAEAKAPHCEHDWRDHDVLVWDNASVRHKAGGNFALGEPRRFPRRVPRGPTRLLFPQGNLSRRPLSDPNRPLVRPCRCRPCRAARPCRPLSALTLNLVRSFQIETGAARRPRTLERTFGYLFQSLATAHGICAG